MQTPNLTRWIKICFFNLLVVSLLGVIMRYKIGFEFAFFEQKNLQHAHSHFAFNGWISLLLMVLMVSNQKNLSEKAHHFFGKLFMSFLLVSFGMLLSFTMQGYGVISIIFSSLSIFLFYIFFYVFYQETKGNTQDASYKWMLSALVFNLLSTLGTFYLTYMMITKNVQQDLYLGSVYWYLHFQYNGWFFFACIGLLMQYVQSKNISLVRENIFFWLFAASCIPAFGLSVLWAKLPIPLYLIIVAGAISQSAGLLLLIHSAIVSKLYKVLNVNTVGKLLFYFVSIALSIKIFLQLGSTIPAVSKFAFGFRPIVIAYLHLVLLAFTSVFLITYVYVNKWIDFKRISLIGIITFVSGVFLNEGMLAIQGIASLNYTVIPFANEVLFGIACLMFLGLVLINIPSRLFKI
jgi:hypothetical protein